MLISTAKFPIFNEQFCSLLSQNIPETIHILVVFSAIGHFYYHLILIAGFQQN